MPFSMSDGMRIERVQGARGILRQWTLDEGRVLKTPEDFDEALSACPMTDLGNDEFDLLCAVIDHLGQRCTAIAMWPDDRPHATILVRFDDGYELYVMVADCCFD